MRLSETHRPAAEHWRFVLVFEGDREAVDGKVGRSAVAFFSGRAQEDLDLSCGDLQASEHSGAAVE